ncbi:MAG TPA: hypothetical protein VH249_10015 [Xanthobacteraceae bacterium]|nr:hypothetical protein [Xanthobacteraceae bacterium]
MNKRHQTQHNHNPQQQPRFAKQPPVGDKTPDQHHTQWSYEKYGNRQEPPDPGGQTGSGGAVDDQVAANSREIETGISKRRLRNHSKQGPGHQGDADARGA